MEKDRWGLPPFEKGEYFWLVVWAIFMGYLISLGL